MSDPSTRRYVLAYDIADERRLSRVHRRVKKDGMALQLSVFDLSLGESRLRRLLGDLRTLIDEREDDVRIYGPRLDTPIAWLGISPFPPGVQLFNNRERMPAKATGKSSAHRDRSVQAPSDAKGPGKILIAGPHYTPPGRPAP